MNLKGKKVVVTGGGSGYGRGIAAEFAKAGAKVWITGRDARKLASAARATGATPLVADVTSGADWDRVMAEVGAVDVLVNNAGAGGNLVPLAEQSDLDIETTIATNLTGALLGCRRAAAQMIRRGKGGAIVNVSSVCALYAWPGWSVYTAAKAGLSKFSHALYAELRPHGIRVTCVTPSWGRTDFNRAARIKGASEDARLAKLCIQPDDLGRIVRSVVEQPDRLAVPDITVQPMIQEIVPM